MKGLSVEENLDFEDLKELNLPPEVLESVKRARIEARKIIENLEPHDISSWQDLEKKIMLSLSKIEKLMKMEKSSLP